MKGPFIGQAIAASIVEQAMTPAPTKKEWCEHIRLLKSSLNPGHPGMYFHTGEHLGWVPDEWTRCPICGKERPKG